MFLRRINRRKDGKCHYYWALVESYWTERGSRQRVVSYIGGPGPRRGKGLKQAAERCESYQQDFLAPEELPEYVEIDTRKVRTERQREFGGVWLGSKLYNQVGLDDFFSDIIPHGKEAIEWSKVIKILVLSRFYCPSSELHIAEQLYRSSAFEDLLGISPKDIYDNRLYRCLDRMLPYKKELQQYLKNKLGELFDIRYDLFLYDVTSTYFEGNHLGSTLAKRGYSRDHRPDCKQVNIALVVTSEGIPLGYEVFEGNRHDSRTVQAMVEEMEELYGKAERIWVMDRGMVSEDNLKFFRQSGRRYIIGTPKNSLKRFERNMVEKGWKEVRAGIEVKLCDSPDSTDEVFILCKSKERAQKERAMHDRFVERIEKGIERLEKACERQAGKDISKIIERRIGRLLQTNSRAAGLFDIRTLYDRVNKKTKLLLERRDSLSHWIRQSEGHYLLRSNIADWEPKELWKAYIHLTDVEAAFRIQKQDLHLRPIWHQKDERIKAHIFVCFLSFVLWKSFGLMCHRGGLGDEPRKVFEEIKRICMVDVVLTTRSGEELKIRTVPRLGKPMQFLLHKLGLSLPERLTKRIS
jgi:transposase